MNNIPANVPMTDVFSSAYAYMFIGSFFVFVFIILSIYFALCRKKVLTFD